MIKSSFIVLTSVYCLLSHSFWYTMKVYFSVLNMGNDIPQLEMLAQCITLYIYTWYSCVLCALRWISISNSEYHDSPYMHISRSIQSKKLNICCNLEYVLFVVALYICMYLSSHDERYGYTMITKSVNTV